MAEHSTDDHLASAPESPRRGLDDPDRYPATPEQVRRAVAKATKALVMDTLDLLKNPNGVLKKPLPIREVEGYATAVHPPIARFAWLAEELEEWPEQPEDQYVKRIHDWKQAEFASYQRWRKYRTWDDSQNPEHARRDVEELVAAVVDVANHQFGVDEPADSAIIARVDAVRANLVSTIGPLAEFESCPYYGQKLSPVIGGPEAIARIEREVLPKLSMSKQGPSIGM